MVVAIMALAGVGLLLMAGWLHRANRLGRSPFGGDRSSARLPLKGLIAGLVVAAALIELAGLSVSLRAYGDAPLPPLHAVIIVGLLTFFGLVSYYIALWTRHRFRQRSLRAAQARGGMPSATRDTRTT